MAAQLKERYAAKKETKYIERLKREVILLRALMVIGIAFIVFANWVLIGCHI